MLGVEEEEYCYIPMGGELPDLTQRVIGFGGAANMVHPATGTEHRSIYVTYISYLKTTFDSL